jgi:hypothetical protein
MHNLIGSDPLKTWEEGLRLTTGGRGPRGSGQHASGTKEPHRQLELFSSLCGDSCLSESVPRVNCTLAGMM